MRKAWFVWEHSSKGYNCAIYYDALPSGPDSHLKPRIAVAHPLEDYWFAYPKSDEYDPNEVQASFNQLIRKFPPPVDPVEPKFSLPLQDAAE